VGKRFGLRILLYIVLPIFVAGCASGTYTSRYGPKGPPVGWKERGVASWYGSKFHGKRTASGEIYNMYDLTAAHRWLPFGTLVKVINLRNHRAVVVRINDRGPFVKNRIIDLSYAAARALGMIGSGTAPVEIERLPDYYGEIKVAPKNGYYVQASSFLSRWRAQQLANMLTRHFGTVRIERANVNGIIYHRVKVGPYFSLKKARTVQRWLKRRGYTAIIAD
jgi:rare lipoprotein A